MDSFLLAAYCTVVSSQHTMVSFLLAAYCTDVGGPQTWGSFLLAAYCTVVGGPHTWVSCLLHTVQLLVVRIRGVPVCYILYSRVECGILF